MSKKSDIFIFEFKQRDTNVKSSFCGLSFFLFTIYCYFIKTSLSINYPDNVQNKRFINSIFTLSIWYR